MTNRELNFLPPRPLGMWGNPEQNRLLGWAIPLAGLAHLAVFALLASGVGRPDAGPPVRTYAIDIAFPPPEVLGMPMPAARGADRTSPQQPRDQAAAEPPPVERKAPERPNEEKPAPLALRTADKAKEAEKPRAAADQRRTEAAAAAAKQPTKGANSTGGEAKAASGPNPARAAVQGEGLNVHTAGAEFTDPAYLRNIIVQINRHFRRPATSRSDEAEVRFWIERDGSVSDIEVTRSAASFAFRSAAMEAVEQAGRRGVFGPLPSSYPGDRLLVSFYFRPAS